MATTSEVNLSGGAFISEKSLTLPDCLALNELTDPAVRAQVFILRVSLLSNKHPSSRANFLFLMYTVRLIYMEMYEKVARPEKLE